MKNISDPTSEPAVASAEQEPLETTTSETTPEVVSLPKEELEALKTQVEAYRDQALRAAADLENYRKRMIREKEDTIRYANSSLLEKLLPVMDNFELGLHAARTNTEAKAIDIINGFAMVERQLGDFLKESGLQFVDAVGQPFDPKIHDALGHESHATLEEGIVISQLRRGYQISDRLLRPASVIVSKGVDHGQA